MATRIVEGQLPYTGGTGIGIDTNKVISILLREENNLIEVNGDNELYTDLQLAVNITPSSDFPVGVTVGKVLAENGWSQNGLILNWKTTSGDYARWLYGADGKIYFDGEQGTWKQVYYSEEVDALFTALRGELATVAFSGDYNDLINRPAFLQIQADWNQTDDSQPDYIKNKPTIPVVNDATLTIQKNGVTVNTFTANQSTNVTANITVPNVINNVTSTSTSDALSANQGKELQDQINDLKAMGRFLSLWDCETGMPISFPLSTPYNYQTGDYFLVENVDTTTNYRPNGVQYTGTASTTPETDEVEIGDMYIYDGAVWLLQINHGKTVSFANLSGQPSDNANLASALNAKANVADLATVATTGDYDDLTNKPTIPAAQVNSDWNANSGVAQILNKPTIPTATSQLTNDSGYITSAYHDSSKQDTLSAGAGISIANDTVTNTQPGPVISSSAPSSPTEGMLWYDTTNDQLKVYDGTNWNVTGKEYNAGKGIEIKNGPDYSAMQGPAPDGFHVPLDSEWVALCGVLTTTFGLPSNATTMGTYLKMPMAGYRITDASVSGVGSYGRYRSSTPYNTSTYSLRFDSSGISPQGDGSRAGGFSVRCFKDEPAIPTSSWTTLYDGSSVASGAGVFYNATDGLISVSGDGTTWYTIQDKNLGATVVYNPGDIETDANCGYFYQWGNNYGFAHSGTLTTSSTLVDASNYGPGNYYSSDTFVTTISSPYDWSSVQNDNLWGGVTGVVTNAITNTGVTSVNGQTGAVTVAETEIVYATQIEYNNLPSSKLTDGKHYVIYTSDSPTPPSPGWQPGANTVAYYPLTADVNDYSGNGYNGTVAGTSLTYGTIGGSSKVAGFLSGTRVTTSLTTLPKTINMWVYKPSNSSDPNLGDWKQLTGFNSTDGGGAIIIRGNYLNRSDGEFIMQVGGSISPYTYGNALDQRINLCVVTDGSTRLLYINGVQRISASGGFGAAQTGFWFGTAPYNLLTSNYSLRGYMSEIILEDVTRTAQEVADYYNQTKANYGIS